VIQEQIEDRIADYYLDHAETKSLSANVKDDQIVIGPYQPTEPTPKTEDKKTDD
jgi:ATP-dependent Clp protease ATP-binding subunit ClpE